jgi:lysylphosphatidylglycerol synthetase-like protein (DUF2156 family)
MNTDEKECRYCNWLFFGLGACALIIGGFLPWIVIKEPLSGSEFSFPGTEFGGVFSVGIGVILLIATVILKANFNKAYLIAVIILGFIPVLVVLPFLVSWVAIVVDTLISYTIIEASVSGAVKGSGIYLSIIGILLIAVGCIQQVIRDRSQNK